MSRSLTALLLLLLFTFVTPSWGVCPEDPYDNGECDTLYVEPWPADTFQVGVAPYFVRVPIYVTHDIADPSIDSIKGFVIPLCYTHTNPSKYCSLSSYWNNTNVTPPPPLDRSIFRHLEVSPGDTIFNRMATLDWGTKILTLDGTSQFWLALVPTWPWDQSWWEGSRVLLAAATFKLEDSMQICIDTCWWPPANSVSFHRADAVSYVPRIWDDYIPAEEMCFNFHYRHTVVTNISDVGNDQGKQVQIDWLYHPASDTLVNHFTIFRRIDPVLAGTFDTFTEAFSSKDYPPGDWHMLGTYPAYGETVYSAVVPTLKDSTISGGMHWSVFFIRAGTDSPILYFDSPVDSGYSLDNLSPAPPAGLSASHERGATKLVWNATTASDFDYYTLYRDTLGGFSPDPSNRFDYTVDTTMVDSTALLGKTYYYLASATDFSGNESDPSNEAMAVRYTTGDATGDGIIDVGDVVYLISYLYRDGPVPNPLEAGDLTCYLYRGGPPPGC